MQPQCLLRRAPGAQRDHPLAPQAHHDAHRGRVGCAAGDARRHARARRGGARRGAAAGRGEARTRGAEVRQRACSFPPPCLLQPGDAACDTTLAYAACKRMGWWKTLQASPETCSINIYTNTGTRKTCGACASLPAPSRPPLIRRCAQQLACLDVRATLECRTLETRAEPASTHNITSICYVVCVTGPPRAGAPGGRGGRRGGRGRGDDRSLRPPRC